METQLTVCLWSIPAILPGIVYYYSEQAEQFEKLVDLHKSEVLSKGPVTKDSLHTGHTLQVTNSFIWTLKQDGPHYFTPNIVRVPGISILH